jgi:hypothetical protein
MQLSSLIEQKNHFAWLSQHVLWLFVLAVLISTLGCDRTKSNGNARSTGPSAKPSPRNSSHKFAASLPPDFSLPSQTDTVGNRVLADYGAVFVARGGAIAPPVIIFTDDAAVNNWQAGVKTMRASIGGINVELQTPAMMALMEARAEAQKASLDITPRDTDASRRSYAETVKLWQSRVTPGLTHWTNEGRLTEQEAMRLRALSPHDQVPEILRLESQGLYFSKDFSKSILYSVAAPGASQHLSMLAFDVKENEDPTVRSILARHGWFQTVSSDTPHFTFLGVTEDQLPSLGLKRVTNGGRTFWIPQLD